MTRAARVAGLLVLLSIPGCSTVGRFDGAFGDTFHDSLQLPSEHRHWAASGGRCCSGCASCYTRPQPGGPSRSRAGTDACAGAQHLLLRQGRRALRRLSRLSSTAPSVPVSSVCTTVSTNAG